MFLHFVTQFLPFCHHVAPVVQHHCYLKFNPVWQAYLKAHHHPYC